MMKQGWLIYNKKDADENRSYIDWFLDEAHFIGLGLKLVLREDLVIGITGNQQTILLNGEIAEKPDFAVVRTIEPLLSFHLETLGIMVFNTSSIARICNDKALTHHHINKLGIPMADTIFMKKENAGKNPPLPYPFVVKDTAGWGGKQVYLVNNEQEWLTCITEMNAADIIVQACNVQLGKDLRVFVVGEEIIGAVLRESSEDFRANFKLGGSARLYQLNETEEKMIRKIMHYFHFDMAGIDFLIGLDGELLFNEIEDVVGSRILSMVRGANILAAYVAHIKKRLCER